MGFNSGFVGTQIELAATPHYSELVGSDTSAGSEFDPELEMLEAVANSDLTVETIGALPVQSLVEFESELVAA